MIWLIGFLFTIGLMITDSNSKGGCSEWKLCLMIVLAVVLWPLFLGMLIAGLINNKLNASGEGHDASERRPQQHCSALNGGGL